MQARDIFRLVAASIGSSDEAIEAGLRTRDELWGLATPGDEEADSANLVDQFKRVYGNISDEDDEVLAAAIERDLQQSKKAEVQKSAELTALDESLSNLVSSRSRR